MMKFLRKFRDLSIEGKKAHQYDDFSRQYRIKELREYASLATHHVPESGQMAYQNNDSDGKDSHGGTRSSSSLVAPLNSDWECRQS
jgi:hypothetical protein